MADYAPREQAAPKPVQIRNYATIRHDSTTYYIAEAATDENGETVANFRLDEVVVVAKSRTLPERKGKVLLDFVVTLPKELQGGCRNVVVVPHLHKARGRSAVAGAVHPRRTVQPRARIATTGSMRSTSGCSVPMPRVNNGRSSDS